MENHMRDIGYAIGPKGQAVITEVGKKFIIKLYDGGVKVQKIAVTRDEAVVTADELSGGLVIFHDAP
jgi:hypothetical protein